MLNLPSLLPWSVLSLLKYTLASYLADSVLSVHSVISTAGALGINHSCTSALFVCAASGSGTEPSCAQHEGAVGWMEQKCSEGEVVWTFTSQPSLTGITLNSCVGSNISPCLILAWSQVTYPRRDFASVQNLRVLNIWQASTVRTNAISL